MKSKSMPAFLLPTSDSYHKYFSDEVCDSLELIEADYGLKGFAVVIKLWQKIYGSNEGYYCLWNDKVCSLFAKRIGASKGLVFEIVKRMIKEGIFDAGLFEQYGILTSEWIQQNWLDYMKRRVDAKIKNEYLLIKCAQNSENASENAEIVCKNSKTVNSFTTTEQNLTEHNLTEFNLSEDRISLLTDKQREELVRMSSVGSVDTYEQKMIEWQLTSGKSYKDPFKTIKTWIAQDKAKKNKKKQTSSETSYNIEDYESFAMNYDLDNAPWNKRSDET